MNQRITIVNGGRKMSVVAEPVRSTAGKILGKMFSLSKKPILLEFSEEQTVAIHMLFVFMPLLVLWLDNNKKVVKARKMLPFISYAKARAKYVLEIPL